jgi:hypothetical protein
MRCVFFLVVAGFAAVPVFPDMPGTLITEGDFHGDEMSAEAGSEWWAWTGSLVPGDSFHMYVVAKGMLGHGEGLSTEWKNIPRVGCCGVPRRIPAEGESAFQH